MSAARLRYIFFTALAVLVISLPPDGLSEAQLRDWTNASGDTVSASLVRQSGSQVILERSDGQRFQILMSQLSAADQVYLRNLTAQPVVGPIVVGRNARISDPDKELVWVAPGRFRMGRDDGYDYEMPVRTVDLTKGCWMGKTEVTQEQYEAVMGPHPLKLPMAERPVSMVSWNDAVQYCEELTRRERAAGRLPEGYVYRLPTEAEWEYAARGGRNGRDTQYAGSNDLDAVAWYRGSGEGRFQPVGTKEANELGLHDMSGNVWEWVHDWYQRNYHGLATTDPTGPESGTNRVCRGGYRYSEAIDCHVAARNLNAPTFMDGTVGFRVVLGPAL